MKKAWGIQIALAGLLMAALACDSSGAPTEAPKILTATPAAAATLGSTSAPPAATAAATVGTGSTAVATNASATVTEAPTVVASTATVEATATAAPVAYLGDVVESGGYSFSVVAVEDPAKPGLFYQKQEGKRLVAVQVVVGNVSGDIQTSNALDVTFLDADGFSYQADLGGRDGQLALVDLQKGERVMGWVAYQIPTDAKLGKVRYSISSLSDITLQSSLADRPAGQAALVGTPRVPPTLPKLGDTVKQGGYSLAVDAVEDPTKAGQFYTPKKGTRLIAVELVLGNDSGAKVTANPLYAYLVDTDGFLYTAELGGRTGQLTTVDLGPGDKVKGWVSFAVPADSKLESVEYGIDPFSGLELNAGLTK